MRDALGLVHKAVGVASVQTFSLQSAEIMSSHDICRECYAIADQHIRQEGRDLWRKLPVMFDLVCYVSDCRCSTLILFPEGLRCLR